MHFGFGMSLGHDQRWTFEQQFPMGFVEFAERHWPRVARGRRCAAHYPEALTAIEHDYLLSLLAFNPVVAIAQKNICTLHQPSEEIADLDQLALVRGLLANLQRAGGHRTEIGGGRDHLGEDSPQVGFDFIEPRRLRRYFEFAM